MNTNPDTSSSPQGGHMLANEWNGIGVAGHVALIAIAAIILVVIISVALAGRRAH